MSLTDLIGATYLEQGRAAAQAAANKGQIWGGAIRSLGQIPQVMEQQKAAEQERQIRAQQLQMGQLQMAGLQKAQQDQQKADQVVAGLPRNADGTFNTPEVLQQLSANGIGSEEQKRRAEYLDAVNKIILSSREQKADQNADLANALLEYHKGSNEPLTPEDVHSIISVGKLAGFATPQDEQEFLDLIASNPDPLRLLQATRDSSKKYRDLNKPVVVQQGGSLVNPQTGEPVFRGTPRPVNVPPGGTLINPDTGETVATGAPREPAPKGLQTKSVLLDGKPAEVVFDPEDGKFKESKDGPEIALSRIKPMPPASQQVTPGSTGALTEEGVDYAATQYRVTGVMPPMGMGNSQARAAIINRAAAQASALGQTPVAAIQKQAAYKADAASLTKMRSMSSSAEAFETKALAQEDIISDLSKKVPRTSFPVINAALQAGRTNITGDENATKLANAIETFSEEYAKIMNGATGSAAAASDSTRAASKRLINAAMSKGTMQGVLDLMKKEMGLTLQGYDATIDHITTRMGGQPPPPTTAAPGDQPKKGDTKIFPNGNKGVFDGVGWELVAPEKK